LVYIYQSYKNHKTPKKQIGNNSEGKKNNIKGKLKKEGAPP
jgi:hypothetical protein